MHPVRAMTLIRAPLRPSMINRAPGATRACARAAAKLEEVAREEICELQQLADARPALSPADDELLGLAWDLR